jgi:hypothetical protein
MISIPFLRALKLAFGIGLSAFLYFRRQLSAQLCSGLGVQPDMKRIILTIMAVMLAVPAFGQGVAKERQQNQKDRIRAGVKDGSVTRAEAARLKQDQREIRQNARRAKSDGTVTGKEAARITRQQNKASRDILKQKNDRQNQK